MALERGFLDQALDRAIVTPFTRLAHKLTRLDQWLCGAVIPKRSFVATLKGEGRGDE
jgi:hypothetical protein